MIEPLMITVMGGVVGSIGMALLLPIFKSAALAARSTTRIVWPICLLT